VSGCGELNIFFVLFALSFGFLGVCGFEGGVMLWEERSGKIGRGGLFLLFEFILS